MVSLAVAAFVLLLVLVAELLHARRIAAVVHLVFGPGRRPTALARLAPFLRGAGAGLLAWGLVTLFYVEPKIHQTGEIPDEEWRHLVLVYDVSPSMLLKDAGANGDQARADRAKELIDSLFERVPIGKFKVTVIATYNGAKAVVEDTKDLEVVRHMLTQVDMRYAFKAGSTKLFDGIAEAARIAKPWRVGSALMVIVSDGDTVPATGMPTLPPSIGGTMVIGVGDHLAGKFIAGHQSKQDESTLRQVAIRLGGEFHNGNKRHVPSDVIAAAAADARKPLVEQLTLREYALLAIAVGSALLAAVPLLLHLFGTNWRAGVPAAAAAPAEAA
ncbi:MAG: VWA domain-containing protein [Planctomycetes bacterium]|nr:VWA domain-containing protein [Planctomycetota bacterium]